MFCSVSYSPVFSHSLRMYQFPTAPLAGLIYTRDHEAFLSSQLPGQITPCRVPGTAPQDDMQGCTVTAPLFPLANTQEVTSLLTNA